MTDAIKPNCLQATKSTGTAKRAAKTAPRAAACSTDAASVGSMHHVKFEIHGKVQGVFFRRDTNIEAKRLRLRGYVLNTEKDTVLGEAFGPAANLAEFKRWLSTKGSRNSRIDKAVFTEEGPVAECKLADFSVRK